MFASGKRSIRVGWISFKHLKRFVFVDCEMGAWSEHMHCWRSKSQWKDLQFKISGYG